jgi:hypothetical protein
MQNGCDKMAEKEQKPGDLLAEQAKDLASKGALASTGPVGLGLAGLEAAREILSSGASEGSMQQYLIASGGSGGGGGDKAIANATLAALNKLATFKSRM